MTATPEFCACVSDRTAQTPQRGLGFRFRGGWPRNRPPGVLTVSFPGPRALWLAAPSTHQIIELFSKARKFRKQINVYF